MIRISLILGFWKIIWHEGSSPVQTIKLGSLAFEWLQLSCHQKAAVFLSCVLALPYDYKTDVTAARLNPSKIVTCFFPSGSPSHPRSCILLFKCIFFKLSVRVFHWRRALFALTLMFWKCLYVLVPRNSKSVRVSYTNSGGTSNSKWNEPFIYHSNSSNVLFDNQIPVDR